MALISENNYTSSSNYRRSSSASSGRRSVNTTNTTASAYVVNAATMGLTGFHYTTCGAGGTYPTHHAVLERAEVPPSSLPSSNMLTLAQQEWGGWFEVASGVPSPPPSPHVAAKDQASRPSPSQRSRSGDAAHYVTEECERLFCETLRAAFLVEKDGGAARHSLVMGARDGAEDASSPSKKTFGGSAGMPVQRRHQADPPTPSPSPGATVVYPAGVQAGSVIREYLEVYDYHATGTRFRGFVAESSGAAERALFVFFDKEVMGQDLKPG